MLADVCRLAGLAVPEDVAIVGVDNFELVCELSNPPLSSVQLPAERIGYESARLLDAMMDGAPARAEPILSPPVRVVTRRSSEVVAVEDKALARALRFIRDHARDGINVATVLAHCRISRSKLEHACEAALGRTPLQEIHRMQVEHACRLLVETDLAMPQVAHQSGLRDAEHLAKLFRPRLGLTPTAYRKRRRLLPGVHGVETGL